LRHGRQGLELFSYSWCTRQFGLHPSRLLYFSQVVGFAMIHRWKSLPCKWLFPRFHPKNQSHSLATFFHQCKNIQSDKLMSL
jgi:hypothetical protein